MFLTDWLRHALDMFRLMAPYLLLGFILAGVLHVIVPREWVARHLGGRGFRASLKAALVGTPLPLCSCGVIPFADLLKRQGASKAAITSFLISTPQTGVDSMLASYGILGLPLTLWKVLTAMISGVLGGSIVGWVDRSAYAPAPKRDAGCASAADSCGCDDEGDPATEGGRGSAAARSGFFPATRSALSYGLGMLLEEVAFWLVIGTLVGGAISAFVPDDFLARGFLNPQLQMVAVLAVAVPLYVCATGSVPVAAALVMKGMPLGAAIVFLIAGPGTNVATLAVFTKVLGRRVVAVYLGTIVVVSVVFGILFQTLFPHATLAPALRAGHLHGGPLSDVTWWEWACSAVLGTLVLRALYRKVATRLVRRRAAAISVSQDAATITLKVEGMTCGGCQGNVERALRGVPGVARVEVLLAEGRAVVSGENLIPSTLIAAVERSGYSASAL